jgi:hypothetical protein
MPYGMHIPGIGGDREHLRLKVMDDVLFGHARDELEPDDVADHGFKHFVALPYAHAGRSACVLAWERGRVTAGLWWIYPTFRNRGTARL